jgi:hypothetical protein
MDSEKFKELKNAIKDNGKSLAKAPENGTNLSQTNRARGAMRNTTKELVNSSYEVVADYLFQEGYAVSFESALIVADVISDEWFDDILEATAATRATVRGRGRVPGAAQRATATNDRKAEAKARADDRRAQLETERKYAEERRNNPAILTKEARKRTLSTRMERAAQKLGLQ